MAVAVERDSLGSVSDAVRDGCSAGQPGSVSDAVRNGRRSVSAGERIGCSVGRLGAFGLILKARISA